MNIGVIYAGGSGKRMKTADLPKQFLEVDGKPIIVHTLEKFQNHEEIDAIVLVCIADWIDYMKHLLDRYGLTKVKTVVPGGETGQLSIYQGTRAAVELFGAEDHIVLIHDGVRPVLDPEVITANIAGVKEFGSAITCARPVETVVLVDESGRIEDVVPREQSLVAKAPQSFWLEDLYRNQNLAISQGHTNEIDSCTLMARQGADLHYIFGNETNIKVTTPLDYEVLQVLLKPEGAEC